MVAGTGAVLNGRDRLVVLFGVAILGILGAAALLSSTPVGAGGASPGGSPDAATLVEGVVGRATSINPIEPRNESDLDLLALVFSGLTRSFPDGTIGPDLAQSWTISKDAKVYTFTLRAGATWQDGPPVTADDVVFTVLTIQDADYQGPYRASWHSVKVEKLDTRTVRFTLDQPVGAFLQATTLPILPAHLLVGVPVSSLPDATFNRQPVGSGPYRLVRLGFDDAELELVADQVSVPAPSTGVSVSSHPSIPRIDVRFFPDGESLAAAYRAGSVDTAAGLLPQHVRELASLPGTTVLRYPSTRLTTLVPNVRAGHPLFTSADVRRGLLRALDRDSLIQGILGDAAERADSPISPDSWAYAAGSSTVYKHDPNAAAADLQKAGWKRGTLGWTGRDGKPVHFALATLDATTDPPGNALAQAIADEWRALGVDVDVVAFGADGFVAQLVGGDFDIALLDVNMGLDPDVFPLLTSSQAVQGGSNVGGYQSGALDKLLAAARSGTDRAARARSFADLQAALTRDLPLLPIAFTQELYVVDARLSGPDPRLVADRSGRFWDVLTWRLAGGIAAQSP